MIPLVVGTREDVAGFALAGIDGVVCETSEEAAAAIVDAGEGRLVILSHEIADRGSPIAGSARTAPFDRDVGGGPLRSAICVLQSGRS